MILDIKNRRIAIGPYVMAGSVSICRLWLWDYVHIGNRRKIVRHTSIHSAQAVTTEKVN